MPQSGKKITLLLSKIATALLFTLSVIHSANVQSAIKEVPETPEEQADRLNNIAQTVKEYQINVNEKFIYQGDVPEAPNLQVKSIVYRDYSSANPNQYVYMNSYGNRALYQLPAITVLPLSQTEKSDYPARISRYILEKDAENSRIRQYYGDKYDDYYQQKIKFVKKIIDSDSCDAVISADAYSFGEHYFSATCGDRSEIKQTIDEINQNKPIDKTIKKTYITVPEETLKKLRSGQPAEISTDKAE